MLESKMRCRNLAVGEAGGFGVGGDVGEDHSGSKLPRRRWGSGGLAVSWRTLVWTYSASSSAVTTPSPVGVGVAFHALDDVVGEDPWPPLRSALSKELLAVAAGGEGEEALAEIEEAVVEARGVGSGVMAPEWQASVRRIFQLALILPPIRCRVRPWDSRWPGMVWTGRRRRGRGSPCRR